MIDIFPLPTSAAQVEWIGDHLRDMCRAAPPGLLDITIYITRDRTADEPEVLEGFVTDDLRKPRPTAAEEGEKAGEKQQAEKRAPTPDRRTSGTTVVQHNAKVMLKSGRPDFDEIVEEEVARTDYDEWIAFGTCGPGPLTGSLAGAVSRAVQPTQVLRGELRRNITFEIEEYGI